MRDRTDYQDGDAYYFEIKMTYVDLIEDTKDVYVQRFSVRDERRRGWALALSAHTVSMIEKMLAGWSDEMAEKCWHDMAGSCDYRAKKLSKRVEDEKP